MHNDTTTDLLWARPQWLATATAWLDARLAEASITRTGEVTQPCLRLWGTVLTAPTDAGRVWLKAPGPDGVFEVELYDLLHRIGAPSVLDPLAVDLQHGWVLLPDGETSLGDQPDADLGKALADILPHYAQLQRSLSPHVSTLLGMGVADMRAPVMPERFDEAVAAVRHLAGRDALDRVVAMRPAFSDWCAELAEAAVPASLDHNDLHPWNILPTGPRFYDWGDSVVAHPFASLLLALGFVREHLGVAADDPVITRARDAYLEVFSDLAPHRTLVREARLACRIGMVARALVWDRSIRLTGYDNAGEFASAPVDSLTALLTGDWIASI